MAMDKVNNYSQVDSNILELQLTTDKAYKSQHTLTLTNYNNTTVPAIAAGSAIEVNGTLYKADTEEAISTTDPVTSAAVADGTVYVCIVPGATTCTAAFTATAPTWSDSKQGWYGTGGQANYRYVNFMCTLSSGSYNYKNTLYCSDNIKSLNVFGIFKPSSTLNITTNSTTKILLDIEESAQNISLSSNSILFSQDGFYNIIFIPKSTGSYSSGSFRIFWQSSGVSLSLPYSYQVTVKNSLDGLKYYGNLFPVASGISISAYIVFSGSSGINYNVEADTIFIIKKISGGIDGFM
jgi:hypothetical protein